MANETTTVPQVVETTTVPQKVTTTVENIKALLKAEDGISKVRDESPELNDQFDNSRTGSTMGTTNNDYMYLELLRAIPTFGGLQLTADERTDLAQITMKIVKHLTSDL